MLRTMSTPHLHIFRPGRQTASDGRALTFSAADLATAAAAYDPALHEAPVVVGHPAADAPAYGWVRGLSADAEGLHAALDQVDPAFAELVRAGRYKHVSASFYMPSSPANPVPGAYYLRHVGFLGAQPPAVKGLRPVQFAEREPGIVEFSDAADGTNASLWRSLRDWLLSQFGAEVADRAVPGWGVDLLAAEAAAPAPLPDEPAPVPPPQFAESSQEVPTVDAAQAEALAAENATLKARLAEADAAAAAAATQARHAEHAAFCEQLCAARRLPPAARDGLVALLDAAASAPVEFGEGEARRPLAAALRDWAAALPPFVEFRELTAPGTAQDDTAPVAVPAGYGVDPARAQLHRDAVAYAEQHQTDYATAVLAVARP